MLTVNNASSIIKVISVAPVFYFYQQYFLSIPAQLLRMKAYLSNFRELISNETNSTNH